MERVDSTVRGRLTALGAELESRTAEISADVEDAIRRAIPAFAADTEMIEYREASIRENVAAMLRMVRVGIDAVDVQASSAALAYARHLARRGTPPALIVRCYRVGQSRFLRHCLEGLSRQEIDEGLDARQVDNVATIVLIDHVSDFIDRVLDQVLSAYEQARDRAAAPTPVPAATAAPAEQAAPGPGVRTGTIQLQIP